MLALSQDPLAVLLRKLDPGGNLSPVEKQAIRSLPITIQTFGPNRDIVSEGGPLRQGCVVIDGWTGCYQSLQGGRRQIVSLHLPGDMPDLQSLYLPEVDFGVAALSAATIAFVPHAALHELVDACPGIATALFREVLINAAIQRAWITGLGRRNARERLAHLFCEIYLRLATVGLASGHVCPMPLRQPDLADATGLTPVHVNRTLSNLRAEGLVRLQGRMLEILDWQELCVICEFNPRYLHLIT